MPKATPAFEIKGRMLSATRIRVLSADFAAIQEQISDLQQRMPLVMRGMIAMLDADQDLDLAPTLAALTAAGIQVIGVVDGPLAAQALTLGLPLLPKDRAGSGNGAVVAGEVHAAPAAPANASVAVRNPPMIISAPVRSGQQVYAPGADLIILSSVGAGAEVSADGSVHVYGALRGRAMAGARGDQTARIIASRFEADVVVIGPHYVMVDQIADVPKGKPAQVLVQNGQLAVEALNLYL